MATLLVSDTSVLVDLERGGILREFFDLPFDIGVPDVLFEDELEDWEGPDLVALGLKVLTLTSDGVSLAQTYQVAAPELSIPDSFALALAKMDDHILLAGDASLRNLAEDEHVVVHGVLWVFDQLEESGVAKEKLHAALSAIASHPRCRLPNAEIQKRLNKYLSH